LRQCCHLYRANVTYARKRHVLGKGHLSARSFTSGRAFTIRAGAHSGAPALQCAVSSMESMRERTKLRALSQ
jgi:hypothetical protein